jgi:hypothetical protein
MKSIGSKVNKLETKKQIKINTNLEPNQSKKQYEMALVQAKLYQDSK